MLVVKEEREKNSNEGKSEEVSFIIKARLRGSGRVHEYNPGSLDLKVGDVCIVETKRGLEIAVTAMTKMKDAGKRKKGRRWRIVRKADPDDLERLKRNEGLEKDALAFCQERIREREIAMKLARVEYDLMAEKATFYFSAEGRVDFRDLVKDISHELKVKVEMWQIGVRDEARISGGCGTCGKPLCCSTFLKDFEPVSIRMAKDQSLALNPMKISGTCGRLMCCLGYEHKTYCKMRKGLPRVGRTINTVEGKGKITQINVLLEKINVRLEDGRYIVIKPCEVIREPAPQKSQKEAVESRKSSQNPGNPRSSEKTKSGPEKKVEGKRSQGRRKRSNRGRKNQKE